MQKYASGWGLQDWRDLQFFLAVARFGSFSGAGKHLKTNQSTVSRRIQGLEEKLGTKLFDRHKAGMRLTPTGEIMFRQAADMEASALEIEQKLAGADKELSGTVRISLSEGLAEYWLVPRLVEFQQMHPHIVIELVCKNRVVDLALREADIAIRYVRPREPRLVIKKVGVLRLLLFASQSYLHVFGEPKTYDDLFRHRLVDHTALHLNPAWASWMDLVSRHDAIVLKANSTGAILSAIHKGMGIGLLPAYTMGLIPEFVPLEIDLQCRCDMWLVSHEETNRGARVRAVLDHLSELFERDRSKWFCESPSRKIEGTPYFAAVC